MAPPNDSVDLHGLSPDQALRRLEQALHTARVQRLKRLHVITGRGWGNREQKPVLRQKVEAWLHGPDGRRWDVAQVTVVQKGGALDVELR